MRLVEADAAFFGGAVVLVLIRVRVDAVAFVAAVALHQGLRVGVRQSEDEAAGVALSQADLKTVVPGISAAIEIADARKRPSDAIVDDERIRPAALDGVRCAGGDERIGIVQLDRVVEVCRLAADISDTQSRFPWKAALDIEAPLRHIRLEIIEAQHVGVGERSRAWRAERIGEVIDGRAGHEHAIRDRVREVRTSGQRRIQIQDRVVIQLVNVVVDPERGPNHPIVRQAICKSDARHELLLRWFVELVHGTNVGRDVFGRIVAPVAPFRAAPQALERQLPGCCTPSERQGSRSAGAAASNRH